ncbi:MAG: DEAD/DEAH box helicase family protein [Candidatus Korarchaeum sp.]
MIHSFDQLFGEIEYSIRKFSGIRNFTGLYSAQKRALMKVLLKVKESETVTGILQMPTGSGKTLLVAALMLAVYRDELLKSKLLKRFGLERGVILLFLTPRSVLRQQTYDRVKKIVEGSLHIPVNILEPMGGDRLGYISQLRSATGVVITTPQMIGSILRRRKERRMLFEQVFSPCIIVLDEAHVYYVGEKMKRLIDYLKRRSKAKLVLGLTATPTCESIKLLGDIVFRYSSLEAMAEGVLIPRLRVVRYSTLIEDLKPECASDERDGWKFAVYERAERYAEKIVEEAVELGKTAGRLPKLLIVSVNTTEADLISRYLHEHIERCGLPFTVFKAHYREPDARGLIEEFKHSADPAILITVNMADIGFDDPDLDMLVIARPLRSPVAYVQVRGRVLRRPISEDSVKKKLGYAVIIDLTGEAVKHEKREVIERVEGGIYGEEEFRNAERELRGEGEVVKAHAKIQVSSRSEFIVSPTVDAEISFNPDDTVSITFYVNRREKLRIAGIRLSSDLKDNLVSQARSHGLIINVA